MPGGPQFEKDIAALRSHVVDGIEDVKQGIEIAAQAVWWSTTLQKWILAGVCVIAILVAVHVIHHW